MASSSPRSGLVPTGTAVRCRICQSPARATVDDLLGRLGEKDDALGTITLGGIVALFSKLDPGKTVSLTSLKRHRKLHSRKATHAEMESGEKVVPDWKTDEDWSSLVAYVDALVGQEQIRPSQLLQLQQKLWLLEARRKLKRGELPAVTGDAAARASALLQKSEADAAQGQLLSLLGQGIEMAFKGRIGSANPAGELTEGELVEDAELIEVKGGGAAGEDETQGGDVHEDGRLDSRRLGPARRL